MKKKGFTLIELLAVIVILAIIALIATPMILGVIDSAKKGAAKSSAYGILDSVEATYFKYMLTSTDTIDSISSLSFTFADGQENSSIEGLKIAYKGTNPKSGKIVVNNKGETMLALYIDKYCFIKAFNESEVSFDGDKNEETCVTPILATDLTVDKTEVEIGKGKTETITAVVMEEDTTNKELNWTSSDENVATVANGIITAVENGTAIITVSTTDGSSLSKSIQVNVVDPPYLAKYVQVGDYVAYTSTKGNSGATVTCLTNYVGLYSGWRVLSNDGETVRLVSAGSLQCINMNASTIKQTMANIAAATLQTSYGNSNYVEDIFPLTKEDIDSFSNTDSLLKTNEWVTLANINGSDSTASVYYLRYDGKVLSTTASAWLGLTTSKYGIRIVITLKSSVLKVDGSGVVDSPFTIDI